MFLRSSPPAVIACFPMPSLFGFSRGLLPALLAKAKFSKGPDQVYGGESSAAEEQAEAGRRSARVISWNFHPKISGE